MIDAALSKGNSGSSKGAEGENDETLEPTAEATIDDEDGDKEAEVDDGEVTAEAGDDDSLMMSSVTAKVKSHRMAFGRGLWRAVLRHAWFLSCLAARLVQSCLMVHCMGCGKHPRVRIRIPL